MSSYQEQAKFWSLRDSLLDSYWNKRSLITRSKWFAEKLKEYEFDSIYEVGMYNGRNLKYIHDVFPDVKVGGLDVNESALKFAKEQLPNGSVLDLCDAAAMDTTQKYDIVFTHGVLMHIPPDGIKKVIDKCIEKANKYVIHIERKEEHDYFVLRGSRKATKPATDNIIKEFRWAPVISRIYKIKRLNIIEKQQIKIGDEKRYTTFLVIKL